MNVINHNFLVFEIKSQTFCSSVNVFSNLLCRHLRAACLFRVRRSSRFSRSSGDRKLSGIFAFRPGRAFCFISWCARCCGGGGGGDGVVDDACSVLCQPYSCLIWHLTSWLEKWVKSKWTYLIQVQIEEIGVIDEWLEICQTVGRARLGRRGRRRWQTGKRLHSLKCVLEFEGKSVTAQRCAPFISILRFARLFEQHAF